MSLVPDSQKTREQLLAELAALRGQKRAAGPAAEEREELALLQRSEVWLEAIAAAMFEGLALTEHGRVLDVNQQMPRLLGYTREEMIGREVSEFIAPEDRERVMAHMRAERETGLEQRVLHKDGSILVIESHARMIAYKNRKVRITMVRDITGRKRVEDALRQREAELERAQTIARAVMDTSRDSMALFDVAGRLIECNAALAARYGRKREDLPGTVIYDYFPATVAQARRARIEEVVRTRQAMEFADSRDGRVYYNLLQPLLDDRGNVQSIALYAADITERTRAEEALRASEAGLRAAERIAQVGSWQRDLVHGTAKWSEEMERIFGAAPLRAGSWRESLLERVHPEDRQRVERALKRALEDSEKLDLDYRIRLPDGTEKVLRAQAEVLRNQEGKAVLMRGTAHDITERRQLEEQLRQSQKMEAIGQLAGGIAHDFRNQLTVIAGFAELLRDRQFVPPAGQAMLQELLKAAQQATHLTGQLLAFSRKQMLRPQLVDVGKFVGEACVMLRRLIGEDVRVTFEQEAPAAWIQVDEAQLQQALLNIANNARDAMPDGGALKIRTFGATPAAEILRRHAEARSGNYAAIAITDTGQGMEEKTLARIFEPFFTTKQPGKGTGLGLSMVYGFVNQSGGFIDVESQVGAGSTFTLYFPRAAAAGASAAETPGAPGVFHQGAGILIVEDEPAVRKLMATILARAGYAALEAVDAPQALEMLADSTRRLELLISDVVMPGMSGVALAVEAKKLRPNLGVLLVSGYTDREVLKRGLEQARGTFLRKPFEADELLQAVREALEGRETK